ncbi:hypothetical protein SI65_07513 [Aspergillus cristatus]|uniref:tRNA (guanine(26)-N(2))-dimethyltransferase n=1 Tax=Aspergillus cristatus TaxID=573508 RepID=A0A1E3B872_ASPCR|nr:hypothetical protein SI65_07513 [Aspergillus cristatus]
MAAEQAQAADQLVQHDSKEYKAVKEGLASILTPPTQSKTQAKDDRPERPDHEVQSVFYNPIQQFNRDLSVLAIRAFGEHVLASKKQKAEKRKQRAAGNKKGTKRKRGEENSQEEKQEAEGVQENKVAENNEPVAESHPEQNTPPSFTILDALSATGLRALRYASEIPFSTCVVANDLSPSAIQSMKTNIEYNGLGKKIQPNIGDARAYMYSCLSPGSSNDQGTHTGKFDVIDLDPYGTAAPFLDAAVQGVKDGGLLCVTCTDAGVWASNGYPEKSFALYGGIPIKGGHSHEGGLRLILHALATSAAKYGLAIEPLLSLSIDFYARVFVRVHRSPHEVKFTSGNMMLVYNCDAGCGAWSTQPLSATKQRLDKKGNPFYHYGFAQAPTAGPHCSHCGIKTHLAGPMWAGPLHNPHYIQKILDMLPGADKEIYQTTDRIEGMLTTALEEDLDLASSSTTTTEHPDADAAKRENGNESAEPSAIIPRLDPAAREPYPFYMNISYLSKVLRTSTMPVDSFRGALRHLGYRTTRSHAKPNTIRTDAPWEVIWEVMREWVRQKSPIKESSLSSGSPGAAIMAKSRENLRKLGEQDQLLSSLKSEILSAVESGKDASDLVTKVEAALYRSGSRQALGQATEGQAAPAAVQKPATTSSTATPHPSTLEVVFDEALGREASATNTKKRLVRYQVNPRANWGPLNRASAS